ncbi:hypothetical protein GOP47_0011271 [Adiantum capillus-veneris]|uniref:KOW domain-containing protein n=1 Tax=Adiantum capillus-veneris TaxID=13818 RepID=A0A9D4USH1_ADICA|nr:hypothetical protein GOP47_0011271 [Adiantum capillus-veneris]
MGWKKPQVVFKNWKILRGDKVMIIAGRDKGLTGNVTQVVRSKNRVIVEGRNLVKKTVKRTKENEGGIFDKEAPLHVSNVQLLDPVSGSPCKVGFRFLEDGTKVRVSRGMASSESIVPRPEILKERRTPRITECGPRDTPKEEVMRRTYDPYEDGKRGLPVLLKYS